MTAEEIAALIVRVLEAVPYVIAAGAALAAFTPTTKDDNFWAQVRKVINLAGLNVNNAKNKDE